MPDVVPNRVVLDSDFSGWLDSDSCDNPGDSTLTQLNTSLFWIDYPILLKSQTWTWLNSDSTHLSQNWVKSDSWLITLYLIWPTVVDGGGGGVRSNVAIVWFFPCNATDKCKILAFSLQKISDSTLTQAESSWLNYDSNADQRDAWFDSD